MDGKVLTYHILLYGSALYMSHNCDHTLLPFAVLFSVCELSPQSSSFIREGASIGLPLGFGHTHDTVFKFVRALDP